LDETDVREIVRLIGEVAALRGGHADKKRYLMNGLSKLVDADAWVWGLSCQSEPDKPQIYVSFIRGGLDDQAFAKLLHAIEHPDMIDLASRFFIELKEKKTHLTRTRTQISDVRQLAESPAIEAWKEADIGPVILSHRPLDEKSCSALGLYRRFGRPEFSARETRIAHIILTEVPWLHEQGWPEDRGVDVPVLSRRHRLTLNLLIQGQSYKQISTHLKISLNTTQEYIKDIYRHFGVHSQAALMSRFFQGDGEDAGDSKSGS
jgi:DNA-binding CsgD family transcriptional regulator